MVRYIILLIALASIGCATIKESRTTWQTCEISQVKTGTPSDCSSERKSYAHHLGRFDIPDRGIVECHGGTRGSVTPVSCMGLIR